MLNDLLVLFTSWELCFVYVFIENKFGLNKTEVLR